MDVAPRTVTVARLQQAITLGLLLAAAGWAAWWWPRAPRVAAAGVLLLLGGHALFLGAECVAMAWVNRHDPAPPARLSQVLRAWAVESVTSPRVFCWQQPFRSRAVADLLLDDGSAAGRQGVVLVHGLACNRGFWNPWLRVLRARGQPCIAVDLEPLFAPIDAYAATIDAAVVRMAAATGRPPVLVGHSMGGLAIRAWLRAAGDDRRVARIVTLGSPHQGTWLGRFGRRGNGVQMRCGSDWLCALAASESPQRRALFVCWYSNCDNIVFPASVATLEGADNRFADGVPHVALAFDRRVRAAVLDLLR